MKNKVKKVLPNWLLDHYSKWSYSKQSSRFSEAEMEEVFTDIYNTNFWGIEETRSGQGSTLLQMEPIIEDLNALFQKLEIKQLLDLPCGDFNWQQALDLTAIQYHGADIVKELIDENNKQFATDAIQFSQHDLTKDALPKSDLILNKDCFVHFSFDAILKSVENIKASGSKYFMTTSFTEHTVNFDIATGDWRPINLERAPFNFPKPLHVVQEYCTPGYEKEHKGKALAVWRISDLA